MVRKNLQRERTEENENRKAEGKRAGVRGLCHSPALPGGSFISYSSRLHFCLVSCSLLMTERLGYNPAALSGDKEGMHGLACPL